MNPIVRNILAVLIAVVVSFGINMGIILLGSSLVPPPEGVDVTSEESIAANIDKFEFKHFLIPFLAHALSTLVGAFLAAKLAATRKMVFAFVIGGISLLGGVISAFSIPAPSWFLAADLILAYIPMAWLGGRLAGAK